MDTDGCLRSNYNMKQLLHDLISVEVSGVLPLETSNKLTRFVEPNAVSEISSLKILELANHDAFFKSVENYLQFVLDQNTEVQYALQSIEEEIKEMQNELIQEKDLDSQFKSAKEAYVSSLKCLLKVLPNIKPKKSVKPLPPLEPPETDLNKEIAELLATMVGPKMKKSEILRRLNEVDKNIKTNETHEDIFSLDYISKYVIRNAKQTLAKMEKIRKWQKLIPWKQKRILEMLLNSRTVPWKSYYNNYSSFQNLLGNLAEIYNINFSFRIYWENLSTKMNNNFINFIKIYSIMEAEADEFKHNATGFKYNNLIKPRINLTKEANEMKDYEIQVLHAINHGDEQEVETLWKNKLRNNLNERTLIEFKKIKDYMHEQQLQRKCMEEQIKLMESKSTLNK